MAKKYYIGILVLVILTASIYVLLPNNVRIDVGKTYSTFKVWENDSWVLAGQEYTLMFDGTKKMRASSRVVNYTIDGNVTKIYRYAYFKNNVTIIDTYTFDGNEKDIELFPISHDINVLNGEGYLLVYEVTKLDYSGETINGILSPQEFGHNMRIEWEEGNYYSRIWKYSNRDEGKLTIKYRPDSANFTKQVRLFDPLVDSLISYWKLDESSGDAIDAHGNNDCSLTGPDQNQPGKINTAYVFVRANTDFMTTTTANLGSTYSISMWVKMANVADYQVLTAGQGGSGTGRYQGMLIFTGTAFQFLAHRSDSGANTGAIGDTDWHHIVGTSDGTEKKIYLDGELADTENTANTGGWDTDRYFGRRDDGYYFDGTMDEVAYFDSVLDGDDVIELYGDGTPPPYPFEDTCTYTSGNWNVNCNDNCSITSNVNLGGNNLSLSGVGSFDVQANITDFGYIFKPNGCQINVWTGVGSLQK